MFRVFLGIVGLLSFAILLAEVMTAGLLLARGQLDSERIAAIEGVLAGEVPVNKEPEVVAEPPEVTPSSAFDRDQQAGVTALELTAQADHLEMLQRLLDVEAVRNDERRVDLKQEKKSFEESLAVMRAQRIDEAVAQTRAIVMAMPPRDAVRYLMQTSESDTLNLLQGLPEKNVAKLLQEFAAGTDEEQQRGQMLFGALAAGDPETGLIDNVTEKTAKEAAP